MAMSPSEITALMSSGQSLSSVANQFQNAGVSLADISKASGASVSDLTNILGQGGVSFGGYTPPAVPTQPAQQTPTSNYQLQQQLNAKSGGATLLNDPYTQAYSSMFANQNTGGGGLAWAGQMGGIEGFAKWAESQPGGLAGVRQSLGYADALDYNNPNNFIQGKVAYNSGMSPTPTNTPQQRAPSYTAPINQSQTKPLAVQGMAPIGQGGYNFGNRNQMRPGYGSMYPYQNYGRQGMFGGTATSRMPMTGYQAYQPYGGYGRNTGMFGAPTMNYNMRNRPMQMQPNQPMGWSQNNPWSTGMGGMSDSGQQISGGFDFGMNPYIQSYMQQYPRSSNSEPYTGELSFYNSPRGY